MPQPSQQTIHDAMAEGVRKWLTTMDWDECEMFVTGIGNGVYSWLVDHPISAHGVVERAIRAGVTSWMDENKEEIMKTIAREVRR